MIPAAYVLAILGPALGVILLAHGATSLASGRYMGEVFALFCLGLLPYMFFQLQLRVFYSLHDSRTPALIGAVTMVVNVLANLIALAIVPPGQIVAFLGVGFGLAKLAGAALAWRMLSRRMGGLDGWFICRSLVRMHAAAIPAAIFAIVMVVAVGGSHGFLPAVAAVVLGGGGAVLIYVLCCRLFRVAEITELLRTVTGRFRR